VGQRPRTHCRRPWTPASDDLNAIVFQARIAEIMRAGAERAEVTVEQVVRELKLIGFSDTNPVPQNFLHGRLISLP
jgi:hypothetical protein